MTRPKALIPVFVRRITYTPRHPDAEYTHIPSFEEQYPVAAALADYGAPAIQDLLTELSILPHDHDGESLQDQLRRSVIVHTLVRIGGDDNAWKSMIRCRISEEIEKCGDREKANLRAALRHALLMKP
jgi:hypothetical protein